MAGNERTVMNRTNVLETTNGTIRITGRWPRKDKNRGPPDLPANFRISTRVEKCLDSLNVLQSRRTQYLLDETLAVPLQFLHDSIPYMVQQDVNIFQPVQEDIWSLSLDNDADQINADLEEFISRHDDALTSRRYHLWPIDISPRANEDEPPHWALIVLHLVHRRVEEDNPDVPNDSLIGPYNALESYAVIDPNHGNAARELENETAELLAVILPEMGITVDDSSVRENPWVAPSHNQARFWDAHPGWINLDAVRSNMIGMAATMVNRAMNSTTRIAIEPILDGAIRLIPYDKGIRTQTMMPNRRQLGSFIPGLDRKHPAWLQDTPADDTQGKKKPKHNGGDDENNAIIVDSDPASD
ncbi:hypothetical protein E0Z10_g7901 [Xylaria hypoxylon]|uniref:Ubiquitin-like protease family profile domain-containing protein n=1 Tax=Xylaria hypoxylon TaxID=37992 RepID=A0A4Z0YAF0_9PEZI|nr:hypothetical protein E0Z10_g7901 [Xylaria hypoxylon]